MIASTLPPDPFRSALIPAPPSSPQSHFSFPTSNVLPSEALCLGVYHAVKRWAISLPERFKPPPSTLITSQRSPLNFCFSIYRSDSLLNGAYIGTLCLSCTSASPPAPHPKLSITSRLPLPTTEPHVPVVKQLSRGGFPGPRKVRAPAVIHF